MNKLVKILLLALYTFAVFAISIAISTIATKSVKRFKEYSNVPYNEDMAVNVQVIETRQSKEETKTDYEYVKYDVYVFLTKKTSGSISNIYSFLCAECNGKYHYHETTSAKSMGVGTYQSSTTYFLNSSEKFSFISVVKDEETEKVTVEKNVAEKLYIKIAYDVQYDTQSKEVESKEINYVVDINNIKTSEFESYEQRNNGSSYVEGPNDPIKLKLSRTITENEKGPNTENYKVAILETYKENLPEGTTIEDSELIIYGLIGDESMLTDKVFSKYVRLFSYTGAMVAERPIRTSRTCSISEAYKLSKIYVSSKVKLSNGEVITTNYWLKTSELQ